MRFLDTHIRNFRLHADTFIEFPLGVVGIVGDNEAGKSAVLEAMLFCLYGGSTSRGTAEGLRWHGAPARKTISVKTRLEVAGVIYRVERTEGTAKVFNDETGKILAEGKAPVNEFIPKLIGKTYDEFVSSDLVLQKDVDRIASFLPTERQAFVRKVMGVGSIDDALKACRKRKSELSVEMTGLLAGLGERGPLDDACVLATSATIAAKAAAATTTEEYGRLRTVHAEKAASLQVSADLKVDYDRLTLTMEETKKDEARAFKELARLKLLHAAAMEAGATVAVAEPDLAQLPGLQEEVDGLKVARSAISERGTLGDRRDQLTAEIDGPDGLKTSLKGAEAQVAAYDSEAEVQANVESGAAAERYRVLREARMASQERNKAAMETAEAEVVRVTAQVGGIKGLGADGPCPTCTQKLGDTFQGLVDNLECDIHFQTNRAEDCRIDMETFSCPDDDEIEAEGARDKAEQVVERHTQLQRDADFASRQLETLRPRLRVAKESLQKCTDDLTALPTVEFDEDRFEWVVEEIKRLKALDTSLVDTRGIASQVESLDAQMATQIDLATVAIATQDETNSAIEAIGFDSGAHEGLALTAESARISMEEWRVKAARADQAHSGAKDHETAANSALIGYDARAVHLNEVTEEHLLHEQCAARLDDFRVAVAVTIRPDLEERMGGYIHILTDGRHEAVTLTEDFSVILHESGLPMEVISGGTEDIAALAMRLALSQMISERAGHPLSLLILDEPYGSLDKTRRTNVLNLIRKLRETFRQVIVISHVEETRDAVDHVVELEFDEALGRTRVVGAA